MPMQVRPMRRKKQELSYGEALGILRGATSGVLALQGDGGYPYAVPLSFAVEESAPGEEGAPAGDALAGFAEAPVGDDPAGPSGAPADFPRDLAQGCLRIYFHCAPEGYKLDCIARNDRASFCVVGGDEVVPVEFTTYFRSAVAFGRVRPVEGHDERVHALRLLADKYAPGLDEGFAREVTTLLRRTCVLRLDVEALTGKEAVELVRARG